MHQGTKPPDDVGDCENRRWDMHMGACKECSGTTAGKKR